MRTAVVFGTPCSGWDHPGHERRITTQVAAWKHDEGDTNPCEAVAGDGGA